MDEKEKEELVNIILKKIKEKTELEKKMNQPILKKFVWENVPIDNPANDKTIYGFGKVKTISMNNFVNIFLAHSEDEVYLIITDMPGNTAITINQWDELIDFFKKVRDEATKHKEDLKKQNLIKEKELLPSVYVS
jgi:hypothetical protein